MPAIRRDRSNLNGRKICAGRAESPLQMPRKNSLRGIVIILYTALKKSVVVLALQERLPVSYSFINVNES